MPLSSPAFARGGAIPTRYTCDGANVSPPLQWQKLPSGTVQLFLFALDLAGGPTGAIQWAVGGIGPSQHEIVAGSVPSGAIVGRNSAGKASWGGLCAAKGKRQSVVFLLYALRHKLNLKPGFEPQVVQSQLRGNTLAAGITAGTYTRP